MIRERLVREEVVSIGRDSIATLIDEACKREWKAINVYGSKELLRSVWFEGQMRGIDVRGYKPTVDDIDRLAKMRLSEKLPECVLASTVVRHYRKKVIPAIEHRLKVAKRNLKFPGMPVHMQQNIQDTIESLQKTLGTCNLVAKKFRSAGAELVQVRPIYFDGILRYEPKTEQRLEKHLER